ncbi:MAG: hypothetical protein JOY80_08690 [Candidatus Dormibacteraeota bacterium]|nr:hypothetical protein [Candidatus Dormibacteraeota bacterium]
MLLFAGAVTAFVVRRRAWRVTAVVLSACGAIGTLTSWVVAAVQPGVPPYSLRVIYPTNGARVASPLLLTVCGVRGDGTMVPATDPSHYLVVFVDGHEVATVDAWQLAEILAPGQHDIRVELVTPAHHAFDPPAIASTDVTVTGGRQTSATSAC